MTITTTTEIAGPVNVDFQIELLRNVKALTPYFLGSTPANVAEHSGTFTAKWRRIENLTPTTTPLTELTGSLSFPTRVGTQPTVTDITATVLKYGDFIILTEEVDLLNFNGQTAKLMEVLGIQAGRSLNRLQRNEMEDNSTQFVVGATATTATGLTGGASASAEFTLAGLQNLNNALVRNDTLKFAPMTTGNTTVGSAPIRAAFWGLNHPDTSEDLRGLTGFQEVQTYAGQTQTMPDEVGAVGGVRFIETTEASIDLANGISVTGSATIAGRSAGASRYDTYNTVIFGKDAVGSLGLGVEHVREIYRAGDTLPAVQVISHAKGSGGVADPLNEIATIGWKSWHAPVILNSDWIRNAVHVVTRLEAL